jgi:hypothetical protein
MTNVKVQIQSPNIKIYQKRKDRFGIGSFDIYLTFACLPSVGAGRDFEI